MNRYNLLSACCAIALAGTSHAAINWDFDTGDGLTPDLNGWTIVANGDAGVNGQPLIQVDYSERNRLGADPVLTTAWDRDGSTGGFVGDGAHPTLIARSPSFLITEAGDIMWDTAGGNAGATQAPVMTAGSYNADAQGVVLVRESDGVMIASGISNSQGSRTDTMDITSLGLQDDGIAYYLEVVDNRSGGWGYVEWDNFIIPGELVSGGIIGDFDGDGDVDGVDIAEMFSNFNGPGGGVPTNPATDLDGDGDVDGVDIAQLFGAFTGPLSPASVPEPTSLALLGIGGLAICLRRGR